MKAGRGYTKQIKRNRMTRTEKGFALTVSSSRSHQQPSATSDAAQTARKESKRTPTNGTNSANRPTISRPQPLTKQDTTLVDGVRCNKCDESSYFHHNCPKASQCLRPRSQSNCRETEADAVTKVPRPRAEDPDKRLYLSMKIGQHRYMALMDTGAEETYISPQILEVAERQGGVNKSEVAHQVILANGTPARLVCRAEITVKLNGIPVLLQTVVIESLKSQVVIGIDTLRTLRITIDVKARTIECQPRAPANVDQAINTVESRQRPSTTVNPLRRHDRRLYVPVRIGEITVQAVVDTGAEYNYIMGFLAERAKELGWASDRPVTHQPMVADGSFAKTEGEVALRIRIGGNNQEIRATILSGLKQELLLGIHQLIRLGAIIDLQTNQVRWRAINQAATTPAGLRPVPTERMTKPTKEFDESLKTEFEGYPGKTHLIKNEIRVKEGVRPVRQKICPRNPAMQPFINQKVDNTLADMLTEPTPAAEETGSVVTPSLSWADAAEMEELADLLKAVETEENSTPTTSTNPATFGPIILSRPFFNSRKTNKRSGRPRVWVQQADGSRKRMRYYGPLVE